MKYLSFLLLALFTVVQPAAAWTQKGHAAIGSIAEANLTPAALAQVQALLKEDLNSRGMPSGRTTLADIATWADEIRAVAPDNTYRGWHTLSNPICSNTPGICWFGVCAEQKLLRYVAILKDKSASERKRNEALKWVVHLVGDIHTPLHSGNNQDWAGNIPATLEGWDNHHETTQEGWKRQPETTLHWLWDRDLQNAALKDAPLTAVLKTTDKLPPDAVAQWVEETRQVARKYAYEPLPGFTCDAPYPGPVVLNHAYQQQALPVIRQQIERAGLRLAQLLNELLQ